MMENCMKSKLAISSIVFIWIVSVSGCTPSREDESQESRACNPQEIYASLRVETDKIYQAAEETLGSRPDMTIENVLWFGKGRYVMTCGGRYPSQFLAAQSTGPVVDFSPIEYWTRGDATPKNPGHYIFQTDRTAFEIPILDAESPEIENFGVSIAKDGDILNSPETSVLATYIYGADYLEDWVMTQDVGPRIERHPLDHLVTMVEPIPGVDSYFVVGKVVEERLELVAISLSKGITLLVKGNTVHTNDYVTGIIEEAYPEVWGIDEVRLKNLDNLPVHLIPTPIEPEG
jgi:hypothetical protein